MSKVNLLIFYGSQTGNAQEVAERIWREVTCSFTELRCLVRAMDDYPVSELLNTHIVVFVCSTTGQGDQPDNMKKFWKFLLRKSLPNNSLAHLQFGVLGLGDSSYAKFNHVAKKLYRRLLDLGAKPICDIGLADDQHDLGADAVIDPWISSFYERLSKISIRKDAVDSLTSRWNVEILSPDEISNEEHILNNKSLKLEWESKIPNNSCLGCVISNERTTSKDHFQDVRLIKLKINSLKYKPGDIAEIRPHNSQFSVNSFFELLSENIRSSDLNRNTVLEITEKDPDMPVPIPLRRRITLEMCATQYWDLNAVPRRYAFQLLSKLTPNELEKEKLEEFSSAAGQEDLYNYCNRPRRKILEVLADFPHATANLTLDYMFEIFQSIRPRLFSIASSPSAHPDEIHLLVAVVKYKTKLVSPRLGLCSNYLASLNVGDKIPISIKSGSFRFPSKNAPIIMVGPGTGVAPFRSFIWENVSTGNSTSENLHLFFGCRNKDGDFHCSNEWENLRSDGRISFYPAFSRDQPDKVYVQHIIAKERGCLAKLLMNDDTYIFIAGNAKDMPQSVREAFYKVCSKATGTSLEEAEKFIENMENQGRYQTETWA